MIEEETVQSVFTAAHMMQVTDLEDVCVTFMKQRVSDKNCVALYFFAKSYNQLELQ